MFRYTFSELVNQWPNISSGRFALHSLDRSQLNSNVSDVSVQNKEDMVDYLTELFVLRNDLTLDEDKREYNPREIMDIMTVCSLGYYHFKYRAYVCEHVLNILDEYDLYFHTKGTWKRLMYNLLYGKRVNPNQTACMFQNIYRQLSERELYPMVLPKLSYLFLFMSYFLTGGEHVVTKPIMNRISCMETVSAGRGRTAVHIKQLFDHMSRLDILDRDGSDTLNNYASVSHVVLWNTIEQQKFFVFKPRLFNIAKTVFASRKVQPRPSQLTMGSVKLVSSFLKDIEETVSIFHYYAIRRAHNRI